MNLLSSYHLFHNLRLNLLLRYEKRLPRAPVGSHFNLDMGLHWSINKNLSIALYGRNLTQPDYREHKQIVLAPESTQVERQGYLAVNWRL